ncbi:MAG TPA: glycosyltransferase, partial [Spirillospora sp.]|nr:glycosyltransferase [Spirillospora sp.]
FAGRSVTFTGYKSGIDLSRAFASADIFLFPSSPIETFGLVAAEAMASGIPVVGSNVGGMPEIIQQGINGYMFEPGDLDTMVAQVRELVENPDKRRAMGRAARESMCKMSWEEVMDELLLTYDTIIRDYEYQQKRAGLN